MALEGDGQVPPWLGDHEPWPGDHEPWPGDATGWQSSRIPGCQSILAHHSKTNGFKPHQEQGWPQVKQI